MRTQFLLAAAGLGLAACTPQAPVDGSASAAAGQRQCFRTDQVNSFSPVDRDTVDVRVTGRQVYRLELFAPCDDVRWEQRIAIRSRGSSYICAGRLSDTELIVPGAIGADRCLVTSVRQLSEAEIEASRRRD